MSLESIKPQHLLLTLEYNGTPRVPSFNTLQESMYIFKFKTTALI